MSTSNRAVPALLPVFLVSVTSCGGALSSSGEGDAAILVDSGSGLDARLGSADGTVSDVSVREGGTESSADATTDAAGDGPDDIGVPEADAPVGTVGGQDACISPDSGSDAGATVLACGQPNPLSLAVDAQNLYWTTGSSAGPVMQMPKGGGTPTAIATAQYYPFGVVVDSSHVYFSDSLGAIKRVPIGGGNVTTLATLNGNVIYSLAVNATTLFIGGDELAAIPKDGGSVTVLAPKQYQTWGMTIDGANVYWAAESGSGSVNVMPLGGGAVTSLVSNVVDPQGAVVGGSTVFFSLLGAGKLQSVPVAGGPVTTLVPSAPAPVPEVYDSGNLYWFTSEPTGSILELNVASGQTRTIATGLNYPAHIVVDTTNVYWTVEFDGTVMTAPK
jgi:hypothetical protein